MSHTFRCQAAVFLIIHCRHAPSRRVSAGSHPGIHMVAGFAASRRYLVEFPVGAGVHAHSSQHSWYDVKQRWLCCLKDIHDHNGRCQPYNISSKCTAVFTTIIQTTSCERSSKRRHMLCKSIAQEYRARAVCRDCTEPTVAHERRLALRDRTQQGLRVCTKGFTQEACTQN